MPAVAEKLAALSTDRAKWRMACDAMRIAVRGMGYMEQSQAFTRFVFKAGFRTRTANRIGQSDEQRRSAAHALSLHVGSVAHAGSFVVMAVMTCAFNALEFALYLAPIRRLCCYVINFQDGRERQKSSRFWRTGRRGDFRPPPRSCLLRDIRAV